MKYLRAFVFAAAAATSVSTCSLANAQTAEQPCAALGYTLPIQFVESTDAGTLKCLPAPLESQSRATFGTILKTPGGVTWYNYCGDGFNWRLQFFSATNERALAATPKIVAALATPPVLASLNRVAAEETNLPISDPSLLPLWCPYFQEMLNAKPPVPSYIIKPTGTQTTKATFRLEGGVRNKTPNGVIAVKTAGFPTACNCSHPSLRVLEGTMLYCSVRDITATSSTVAECMKR